MPSAKLSSICREKGVLILAGGLSYHNLGDFQGFSVPNPATQGFHEAIIDALQKTDVITSHLRPRCAVLITYIGH